MTLEQQVTSLQWQVRAFMLSTFVLMCFVGAVKPNVQDEVKCHKLLIIDNDGNTVGAMTPNMVELINPKNEKEHVGLRLEKDFIGVALSSDDSVFVLQPQDTVAVSLSDSQTKKTLWAAP